MYAAVESQSQSQTRPCMGPDRRWKANVEMAPNCPRCASSNTKFCYYNNYSLSQPRYFCKSCRRYWTKGGSLRNVPVGGGCRKTRRSKAAAGNRGSNFPGSSTTCLAPTDGDLSSNGSDGPNIDLAAVFANFLNDNNPDGFSGGGSSGIRDQLDDATNLMASRDDPVWASGRVFDGLPEEEVIIMEAMFGMGSSSSFHEEEEEEDGFNPVCLQTMVNDDQMNGSSAGGQDQDIMWPDPLNVASFGWEMPTVGQQQFQDFGSLPSDDGDQMARISSSLVSDQNWSFFDLSGFELFSGP